MQCHNKDYSSQKPSLPSSNYHQRQQQKRLQGNLPRKKDDYCEEKQEPEQKHPEWPKKLAHGSTRLMHACQRGDTEAIIDELWNKPQQLRKRDRSNKTALHYCSGQKDLVAAASVAMAAPELLETADEDGFTPLHLAVIQGNLSLVNLLLANKADVNALDSEGHSVVHWATVCGEIEALRAVLMAGADVSTPDHNGGSPLHYAAQMCGANYDGKPGQPSSSKLALEILNILLNHPKSSVEVADKDGRQPLLWAASAGSEKAVLAIIKAGARVESADKDGLTALHCAASRGHTGCIDTLISLCGAPTDLIDSNGCTALHYAVTLGHADATSLLLDLDADPNRQDRKGRTPAHCGCAKGQFETLKILGLRNANLWLRNARGDLPVHEAASSGRRELVQWLLEQRPRHINTTSNDGRTLLHYAAGNDNTDMCKMLIDFGADVNSIYRTMRNVVLTPLDSALQKGYRSTAKFLQLHGGLPASKLRLSGRKYNNSLNDQELVKPLKFPDKPDLQPQQQELNTLEKQHYVVYVKRSDSEESLSLKHAKEGPTKSRKKCHHQKRHHRNRSPECSHHRRKHKQESRKGDEQRRRTSSCSDTFLVEREEEGRDEGCMSRSKSNLEIRRRKKSKEVCCARSSSSSSASSSSGSESDSTEEDDSCDNDKDNGLKNIPETGKEPCCKYARKKHKHDKYCKRYSVSVRKCKKEADGDRHRKKSRKKLAKSRGSDALEGAPTQVSKVETADKDTQSVDFIPDDEPATNERKEKEDVAKSVEERDNLQASRPSSGVKSRPTSSKRRPQSARISSAQKRQQSQAVGDYTDSDLALIESQISQDKVVSLNEILDEKKDDSKQEQILDGLNEENEVNESFTKINDDQLLSMGRAADNTEKQGDEEDAESDVTFTIDKLEEKPEASVTLANDGNQVDGQSSQFAENQRAGGDDNEEGQGLGGRAGGDEQPDGNGEEEKFKQDEMRQEIIDKPQTPPTPQTIQLTDNAKDQQPPSGPSQGGGEEADTKVQQSAFSVLPDNSSFENRENRENECTNLDEKEDDSSFMILDEQQQQQASQERNLPSDRKQKRPASFKVLGESRNGENDLSTDDDQAKDEVNGIRKKKLKRRSKNKDSFEKPDDGAGLEGGGVSQFLNRDQDSGFEPSPRTLKSKIPKAINHEQSLDQGGRKDGFTILDERKVHGSGRAEGRKPGDQNACSMAIVNQSIQRNIRRYYMERKIFQHLLELKSLQIRSSKVNEAVLVKRAVDDYHKSVQALGYETGGTLRRYPNKEFTFKNFETFLYETLKSLQKHGTYNFQNISDVYKEAERRLSPDYKQYEKALQCTTKTHRCLHAAHAYTGIPCAAYIPMMNHHTIPKLGFGPYKTHGVGSFYLPKILTSGSNKCGGGKVSLELSHGSNKQLIPLPSEKLDSNKRYYVTFTVKGNEAGQKPDKKLP